MSLMLEHVKVRLGEHQFQFDLRANAGEIHAILGKSGSGKSTLLNAIGGFVTPHHGQISWNGTSLLTLAPEQRPATTLFQAHNLFEHLSVRDNVALGVSSTLKLNAPQWQAVDNVLSDVGLPGRGADRPHLLSGGEQQRAGLARCLLSERPLLLLDEPYGALDEATRYDMLALTQTVATERQLCVLMVTHNRQDAEFLKAQCHQLQQGRLQA